MSAYFSSKAISAVLLAATLLLGGCGAREPKVISPPKDAAAVIEPFLKELSAGNSDKAGAYVSPAATDELAAQFAADHQVLAAAGKLTPRFFTQSGGNMTVSGGERQGDGEEVTMVYAAKSGDKWTSATVRAYKYRDEPYKVEYWCVANEAPRKPFTSNVDAKQLQQSEAITNATIIGMSLLGLFGIALLIWMIRRKPHLLVPETASETRRSASTVREPEE
jgi:hypothetical protein